MTYEGEKDGRKVVVVQEFAVFAHRCSKCGMAFSVMALFLEDETEDMWSMVDQTPNYCYMCGAVME